MRFWHGVRAAWLLVAVGTAAVWGEKPARPAAVIPLERMEVPGYARAMVESGASVASVHLLDDTHVLLTFQLRKLVPRLAGEEEDHQDRLVGAEVVEVPSGKVEARTEWHLHDHGRYLWSLGKGVFLVRRGEQFFAMAPMRRREMAEAFRPMAFPRREGRPVAVLRSPDGEMVTVETRAPAGKKRVIAVGDSEEAHEDTRVAVDFYRMEGEGRAGLPVRIAGVGAILASNAFLMALDGDGYLWPVNHEGGRWELTFNGLGGVEPKRLAEVQSRCPPRLEWLSRSQFASLTCKGEGQGTVLSAWGMDGHEAWEEPFPEDAEPPVFVTAEAAGRFAVSRVRILLGGSSQGSYSAPTKDQELRVYQTESGDLLLKVSCDIPFKTGENFDLSEDGRRLAVLTRESLLLYDLPALTKKDREQMAEVGEFAPAKSSAPVLMNRVGARSGGGKTVEAPASAVTEGMSATTKAAEEDGSAKDVKAVMTGEAVSGPVPPAADGSRAVENEGTEEESGRKAPTLLNPGERPEFQPK